MVKTVRYLYVVNCFVIYATKAVSKLVENILIRPINHTKSTHIFFFHLQRYNTFQIYSNGLLHRKIPLRWVRFKYPPTLLNTPPLVKSRFLKVGFVNFQNPPTTDDFCSDALNTPPSTHQNRIRSIFLEFLYIVEGVTELVIGHQNRVRSIFFELF